MPFESSVLINCPFDKDYDPLLKALSFTIIYLDFEPALSQTVSSATIRINQIKQHIRNSKFGIHDLSRSKAMKTGDLPRFNMPYELGLDIGCSEYSQGKLASKQALESNLKGSYTADDIKEMPIGHYIKFAKKWIKSFKTK